MPDHSVSPPHGRSHEHRDAEHSHTHGAIDPALLATERGLWAIKWSFVGLMGTAVVQAVVVWFSGSAALLADTIHNFGDAATTIPLWWAFKLAQRKPTKRFTYGYGRMEDLAGILVVLVILLSAIIVGYVSIERIIHPRTMHHVWAVVVAALVGFLGNEAVARFRIKVGQPVLGLRCC